MDVSLTIGGEQAAETIKSIAFIEVIFWASWPYSRSNFGFEAIIQTKWAGMLWVLALKQDC